MFEKSNQEDIEKEKKKYPFYAVMTVIVQFLCLVPSLIPLRKNLEIRRKKVLRKIYFYQKFIKII